MNYCKVKLEEVCEVIAGQSPPSETYNSDKQGLPFFQGKADFGLENPNVRIWCSKPQKIAEPNDILLSVRAPVGPTNICNQTCCIGRGLSAIRSRKNIYFRYVLYYFKSIETSLSQSGVGSTFSAITQSDIKALQIPLPDLPTQQHIAAVLDKADALRQQNRQLLTYYDELLQSTFIELFGDPVTNEKGWGVLECRNIFSNIEAGNSYGGEDREMKEGELGVLKVSAVTTGQFKPDEYKAVPKSILGNSLIFPKKGDLLFSRANTRELVAATCIVDQDYENVFLPDKLWRISFDRTKCNQYYFKSLLSQNELRQNLTKTATGTSGSMLNISMEKLRQFEIPLPPLSLQNQFADIVEKIEAQKEQARAALAESESLFEGLLAGYFGEN